MSYTQNGDRIVTTDTVTSRHPMYTLPVHMTTPLNLRDFSVSPTDRFLTRAASSPRYFRSPRSRYIVGAETNPRD